MSSGMKLSAQDRKEVEKFIRFMVFKTIQVVVQSRLGEKIKTKSKPHSSGFDWFNLSISDVPEIATEAKKAIAGRIPSPGLSMCCEMSLRTADGDSMVLETWTIDMNGRFDPCSKACYSLYNRMSLLLKSAIVIARVTPAYKLSTQQGSDSYVICYRIYMGEPQYHLLGEDYQEIKVGQVATALGILSLVIAYRTRMTITPHKSEKESLFMVKSDYFKIDTSPIITCPLSDGNGIIITQNLEQDRKTLPNGLANKVVKETDECPDEKLQSSFTDVKKDNHKSEQNGICNDVHIHSFENQKDLWESKKVGAFAASGNETDASLLPDILILPDTPLLDLLKYDCDNVQKAENKYSDKNANISQDNENDSMDCNKNRKGEMNKSVTSDGSLSDDFVMVELRPPFAECDSNSDLGAFFCECQCAPPLASFSSHPTLEEQVTQIGNQIAKFETNIVDFDEFVDSLCQVDSQK